MGNKYIHGGQRLYHRVASNKCIRKEVNRKSQLEYHSYHCSRQTYW